MQTATEAPVLEAGHFIINDTVCVLIEGSYYTLEDGEFAGFAVPETFSVKDQESCDWVLRKFLDIESQINAVELSAEVLAAKAILANAESMRKGMYTKYRWLEMRFQNELVEYAKKQLEGKKERTFKTVLGSIALRTKKGGLRVLDKAKALEVAKLAKWTDAIKTTEEFQISGLAAEEKESIQKGLLSAAWPEDDEMYKAFVVEPDSETVAIKTGVQL